MAGLDPLERLTWLTAVTLDSRATIAIVRVAGALAHRQNAKTGQLNPKVSTICGDTGLTDRAVRAAVKALEGAGFLFVSRGDGRGHSNAYRLTFPESLNSETVNDETLFTDSLNGGAENPEQPFRETLNGRSARTKEENQGENQGKSSSREGEELVSQPVYRTKKRRSLSGQQLEWFEQFWETFGYKSGKAEAADAWLDLKVDEESVMAILAGAAKEAQARPGLLQQGRTPKMAQGWLSGRRWEDEHSCPSRPSQHSNFEQQDYGAGIAADGRF
jgi:hypothetical protein